jgi:hypothetical protein
METGIRLPTTKLNLAAVRRYVPPERAIPIAVVHNATNHANAQNALFSKRRRLWPMTTTPMAKFKTATLNRRRSTGFMTISTLVM